LDKNTPPMNAQDYCGAFIVQKDLIYLASKKFGFGKGKLTGIGDIVNPNEQPLEACRRELLESLNIEVPDLKKIGELNYQLQKIYKFKVHIFVGSQIEGTIEPTERYNVDVFKKDDLPLNKMWADSPLWMDFLFSNQKFEGNFIYQNMTTLTSYDVKKIENFE
jgi:8-oxo-dGTP diphosphatase